VPTRLRPSAELAADAILVGDPGRALSLAQLLINEPRMSNHARGLWGYTGTTAAGRQLTLQSTGMGAPSAAIVLDDLSGLGVRRVIRIGTCAGIRREAELGEVLVVERALGTDGVTLGLSEDGVATPDPDLLAALSGAGRPAAVTSADRPAGALAPGTIAVDLQTAAILALSRDLGMAAAALLVVEKIGGGPPLPDEDLAAAIAGAGTAAAAAFSTSG
jgi:uridine phosphorylase